jgi:hypothetical protein
MRCFGLVVFALLALAGGAGAESSAPTKKVSMDDSLRFTLQRSADGNRLVVEISFKNTTAKKIYLVDKLVVSAAGDTFARSDRLTVMNTDDPSTARFVLGAVSSNRPSYRLYTPTYAPLEPGASTSRHFELPWPLTSWNPVGGTNALRPTTKQVKLYVYGYNGEPRKWKTLPSSDPEPLKVPEFDTGPLIFEAGPLPLPEGP